MLTSNHYPRNYFDPYATEDRAQCVECGAWFEAGEIDNVEAVPCLERGEIYQGVCWECQEARTERKTT